MNKKSKINLIIAVAASILVLFFWLLGLFDGLENRSLDARFRWRGPVEPSKDVVIVVFDEGSLKRLGKWPWPRSLHAQAVERLSRSGAKAIIFDVLLFEPDKERPRSDDALARAMDGAKNVVLDSYFSEDEEHNPVALNMPVSLFRSRAKNIGFANTFTDNDGVNRRMPVFTVYNAMLVPSLSLAGVSAFLDRQPDDLLSEWRLPLNARNELALNYAGGPDSFSSIPFYKVVGGEYDDSAVKGKIVILGGTALGLFDNKPTPFSATNPGVEIHATAMSNLLVGNFLRPWDDLVTVCVILLFALLPAFLFSRFSPLNGGIVSLALFCGYTVIVNWLFVNRNIAGALAAPLFSLGFSYVGLMFYNYVSEEKEKRWIKNTFSQYLSARVLESIMADPDKLKLGGTREAMTVLFSDIRGFTTISESLQPEEVVELLNEYLTKMVEVVFRHDGTLDKFIGDAVMAFWGAPAKQADHEKKAVLCALDMMEELHKLQEKWKNEGRKIIDIGIGVNTGEMVVGNIGSRQKMQFTIIGDNVNLGSRLEGLNKEFKTHIIISESTWNAVKDAVNTRPLGEVKVKGKEIAVKIFEVTGRK